MEFPGLGKHCSEQNCRQLDFLPVKCDACNQTFCSEHYKYENHNCHAAYRKNVQVPLCPLCNTPVPGKSDELPDIRVSKHIDNDCQSDRAKDKRKNVYTNRCSFKSCKQKELVPILCNRCGQNFCLKHRHEQDHACTAAKSKGMSKMALAAISRSKSQTSDKPRAANGGISQKHTYGDSIRTSYSESKIQGNMSEDVALAMALQASLGPSEDIGSQSQPLSQEQEDFLLAQAIAASEQEARNFPRTSTARTGSSQKNCQVS